MIPKGLSYCTIMVDEWLKLLNECFNPFNERITANHLNILTRDENGNLYATTGTIEGGIDSFYDNTKNSKNDPEPDITPSTNSEAPVQSEPPVEKRPHCGDALSEDTPPIEETPPNDETPPRRAPPIGDASSRQNSIIQSSSPKPADQIYYIREK